MPILTLEGIGELEVGDEFLRLTPDQQNQTVAQIVQEYRARQGGQQPSAAAPQQTGLLGALETSVTRQLPGAVAGGLGAMLQPHFPETAGALTQFSERQEQAAQQEYQRSPDVAPSVRQGFLQAPDTATGLARAGEAAVYGAAESIGSSLPGLISALPVGRLIRGALAVPNFAQIVNSIKEERTAQGLDSELTAADYVNAVLQTGVDVIPGGRTILRMLGSEAAKETGQEVATIEGTTLQGGQRPGREAYLDRLVDAGTIGGLTGAGTQATLGRFVGGQAQPARSDIRSDDSTDAELAQRISDQTGPSGEAMDLMLRGRGDQTGGVNSAIQNVRADLLSEGQQARRALMALARLNGDTDAINTVERFARKALSRNDTNVTQADIDRLQSAFGDTEEGQRLISIARQRARLNEFLQPNATYGPLSRATRFLDPTERNASAFQRAAGGIGNIASLGSGIVINRAAGALERLTGTYSPVERFVRQNAEKDGPSYTGESALDRADALKQSKQRSDTSNDIWEALAAQKRAQGEDVTGEQLRQQVLMREADNRLKRSEETAANLAQGDANRAAKDARNAMAAESLAAAQARRQAAETAARTAREREISTTQQLALKTKLAELTNEIAAGRLEITQASARVADALAQNKLAQSNIRGRLLEIAEQLAQRRLSKSQADAAMRQAVEEEAKTRKEESKRTKSEAEAAAKEAPAKAPSETSLNARQDTAVGPERYGATEEQIAVMRSYIRGEGSLPLPDDFGRNEGAYAAALGIAAKREALDLQRQLNEAGMNRSQVNTYIRPLLEMDSPGVLRSERQRMRDQMEDTLSDYEANGDQFAERALQIADALVLAGRSTYPKNWGPQPEPKAVDPGLADLTARLNALTKAFEKSGTSAQPIVVNVTIPGVGPVAAAQAYVASGGTVVPAKADDSIAVDPVRAGQDITTPAASTPPPSPPVEQPGKPAKQPKTYDQKVKEAASGQMQRARGVTAKLAKEEAQILRAKELAPRYGEVAGAISTLSNSTDPADRLKALILESGTEFHTFLSLSYAYAGRHGLQQSEAAPQVMEGILALQQQGVIFTPKAKPYEVDGRRVKTKDGKQSLSDVQLRFNDENAFYGLLDIAKANERIGKIPAASTPPEPLSASNGYKTGISPGIDGFTASQKAAAEPLIDFLNYIRGMGTGLNAPLYNTILGNLGETNNVSIEDGLNPKDSAGKRKDNSGVLAFSLLKQQIPTLTDGILYQEAHSDSRGRIYLRNSSAFTQGGDFMKAMTRANYKAAPGPEGLQDLFQSWGNLVAEDGKDSINGRINAYIDAVPKLLKLAENPFPKDGKYDPEIEALFQEGPMQTIAVALDTKEMVDFARKRAKSNEKDARKLLRSPEVQADLAANWQTNAVAQFDANNNSFQLFGLFLGDPSVLQATSMMPRPNDDPDPRNRRVADIYVEPAVNAVRNELSAELGEAIKTPAGVSWLRNTIKNSVSTYVYDSTLGGASQSVLNKLVKNYSYINPKLFTDSRTDVKKSGDATTFSYNDAPYRVVKGEGGMWSLQTPSEFKKGEYREVGSFSSEKLALDYPILRDFSNRLTGAVRSNVEQMYPNLRKAMQFFRDVAEWGRDNGNRPIRYQTPDGVEFSYQSDDVPKFAAMEFKITGKNGKSYTAMVPVVSSLTTSGRGLSANFTHAHDAYVLREAARRASPRYYNPIHDSHGFHPSEATAGRREVLSVMGEIAQEPNPFEAMVTLNGIPMITPESHTDHAPNGPVIGAMLEADYNRTLAKKIETIRAASPRKAQTTVEREARKALSNVIVIPKKQTIRPIDPDQILTAVS